VTDSPHVVVAATDVDQDVHTTANGRFRVTGVDVSLGPRSERFTGTRPVQRATALLRSPVT
jgi:hypothetical protein